MRIVFMGTPDFAVESLRILVENKYDVVGVITMPDKPAGRGHKVQFSPVKQYALEQNLRLLQPEKLKDEAFLEELRSLEADLQIVVAFRMLPEVVWNMPKFGTFNLHASLLPQYRGAAPINWAIINGDKETGATTFFLTHEIDTGKIIQQEKIAIAETDNAGIVHDRLMEMGAKLVKKTVDMLIEDKIDAVDQAQFIHPGLELKAAPKIFKETCQIDFSKSAEDVCNFVRGLSPHPAAWAYFFRLGEKPITVKILSGKPIESYSNNYGSLKTSNSEFKIACKDGYCDILSIQFPGKKLTNISDFLRGYRRQKYDSFCFDANNAKYTILDILASSSKGKLTRIELKKRVKTGLHTRDNRLVANVQDKVEHYLSENDYLFRKKYIERVLDRKNTSYKITKYGKNYLKKIGATKSQK